MTAISAQAAAEARVPEAVATRVGGGLARYGLVVVIGWIGLLKFTSYQAQGIQPLVANSPFMGWVYEVFSVTTFIDAARRRRGRSPRCCSRSSRGGRDCRRWAA